MAPREREAAVLMFALLGFRPKVRGVKVCFENLQLNNQRRGKDQTQTGELIHSVETLLPGKPWHLRITQGRGLHLEIL